MYVFGDGFQFMKPWFSDLPNPVVSIVGLHPKQILVTFSDNSMVVLDLPSLFIVDMLTSSWVGQKSSDVTTVYVDAPGEKNFVYVGTSDGVVLVLDILETQIRICDYKITWSDVGLSCCMAVSDVQICPKDEKYLAISYSGPSHDVGSIVLYDMHKRKVVKLFKTSAITCILWNTLGDTFFAASRGGDLVCGGLEKAAVSVVWNARGEREDADDDEFEQGGDDDGDDHVVTAFRAIRSMYWLAPQAHSPDGCLLMLLGSRDACEDNSDLKSVVVGLCPSTHGNTIDMSVVFSQPPIPGEKVLDFQVVPTYDCSASNGSKNKRLSGGGSAATIVVTPALLQLTCVSSLHTENDEREKHLKILRCPPSAVSQWAMEIGLLDEPRLAHEVLPYGASAPTVVVGVTPLRRGPLSLHILCRHLAACRTQYGSVATSSLSFKGVVTAALEDTIDDTAAAGGGASAAVGRRLSARDFGLSTSELEKQLAEAATSWEMAFAAGSISEDIAISEALRDIVAIGAADG